MIADNQTIAQQVAHIKNDTEEMKLSGNNAFAEVYENHCMRELLKVTRFMGNNTQCRHEQSYGISAPCGNRCDVCQAPPWVKETSNIHTHNIPNLLFPFFYQFLYVNSSNCLATIVYLLFYDHEPFSSVIYFYLMIWLSLKLCSHDLNRMRLM